MGNLARSVDNLASVVAKTALDEHTDITIPPGQMIDHQNSTSAVSVAFYIALKSVMHSLGVSSFFVSEESARIAFGGLPALGTGLAIEKQSAALTVRLFEPRVVPGGIKYLSTEVYKNH